MAWLTEPFGAGFMLRALLAGALVATIGAIVGSYVVHRGLAFLGDALAHGILPGIALAFVAGFDLLLGAAIGAAVMVAGIAFVNRRTPLSTDVAIGLLFVGMLALGVAVVSSSGAFTTDLYGFLFGDVLGVSERDLVLAGATLALTALTAAVMWRPFLVLCLDDEKAEVLGLHARLAHRVMLALVALAIVASFEAVGTLLVFAMLLAPAATAALLVHRLATAMVVAAVDGWVSVVVGLVASYDLYELSGGQRQRVQLAQVLAQDADLLLLDEPFAGLDLPTQQRLLAVLAEDRARGATVVVATHQLGVARRCDLAVLLDRRLVAFGPPDAACSEANLARAFGMLAGEPGTDGSGLLLPDHSATRPVTAPMPSPGDRPPGARARRGEPGRARATSHRSRGSPGPRRPGEPQR